MAETLNICEPSELEAAAKRVEDLRADFLLDNTGEPAPAATSYFILALAALEQAAHYLKLASYDQARTNAELTLRSY